MAWRGRRVSGLCSVPSGLPPVIVGLKHFPGLLMKTPPEDLNKSYKKIWNSKWTFKISLTSTDEISSSIWNTRYMFQYYGLHNVQSKVFHIWRLNCSYLVNCWLISFPVFFISLRDSVTASQSVGMSFV